MILTLVNLIQDINKFTKNRKKNSGDRMKEDEMVKRDKKHRPLGGKRERRPQTIGGEWCTVQGSDSTMEFSMYPMPGNGRVLSTIEVQHTICFLDLSKNASYWQKVSCAGICMELHRCLLLYMLLLSNSQMLNTKMTVKSVDWLMCRKKSVDWLMCKRK